ncbi:hypothetical protein DL767_002299 [Monosporascus sp. MG133]|nr:hypothetical protein DL767_002299 [Monosporascus sp. MG133]
MQVPLRIRTGDDTVATEYDIVVIGGGPAGLSVASSIVGQDHSIVLFDSGKCRNAESRRMQTMPTWDHRNTEQFRAAARADFRRYGSIAAENTVIESVKQRGDGLFEAIRVTERRGRKEAGFNNRRPTRVPWYSWLRGMLGLRHFLLPLLSRMGGERAPRLQSFKSVDDAGVVIGKVVTIPFYVQRATVTRVCAVRTARIAAAAATAAADAAIATVPSAPEPKVSPASVLPVAFAVPATSARPPRVRPAYSIRRTMPCLGCLRSALTGRFTGEYFDAAVENRYWHYASGYTYT